jgi:hypothetical protein
MKTKLTITVKARNCYGYCETVEGRLAKALIEVAARPLLKRRPTKALSDLTDLALIQPGDFGGYELVPGTRFLEFRVG